MLNKVSSIAGAWFIICGFVAAHAQTVHEVDFDTTFPAFGYSFDYSGYGDPTFANIDSSDQTTSTYDVNTPPAATATLDTSMWNIPVDATYNYAGWGLGVGLFLDEGERPISGNLADYKVSFDASIAGYDPVDDGIGTNILVLIQTPDDDDPDTGAEQVTLRINDPVGPPARPVLTTTPQSFTIDLDDFENLGGDFDFTTAFSDVFIFILQLEPATNVLEVGLDADNVITVDNVRFEGSFGGATQPGDFDMDQDVDGNDFLVWQRGESPGGMTTGDLDEWKANFGQAPISAIPEPASLALSSLALVLLMARRRP